MLPSSSTVASTSTLLLLTLFLINLDSGTSQAIGKCGAAESAKFDEDAAGVTILGSSPNASFPSTASQAEAWCKQTKQAVKGMRAFSKGCLDQLSRQVANLIAYGIARQQRSVCKSADTRREAAASLRCLNGNYAALNGRMAAFVADYQGTIGLKSKDKLVSLCCAFHTFARSSRTEARKVCSEVHTRFFVDFVRAFSADAIDLLCTTHVGFAGGSSSLDKEPRVCAGLKVPPPPAGMPLSKSFLPPLLTSLATL